MYNYEDIGECLKKFALDAVIVAKELKVYTFAFLFYLTNIMTSLTIGKLSWIFLELLRTLNPY